MYPDRYLDDEISDILERLDPDDVGRVTYKAFLLEGSCLLQGYNNIADTGSQDSSVRSDMLNQLNQLQAVSGSSSHALREEAVGLPAQAPMEGGGAILAPAAKAQGDVRGWGKIYVACVSAANLQVSAPSASVAIRVSLLLGGAASLESTGNESGGGGEGREDVIGGEDNGGTEGAATSALHMRELTTRFVGHRDGRCDWNEDMQLSLPGDFRGPESTAASPQASEGAERSMPAAAWPHEICLAVRVIEATAASLAQGQDSTGGPSATAQTKTDRVIGLVEISLSKGEVFRALQGNEAARQFDRPFALSAPDTRPHAQDQAPSKDALQTATYRYVGVILV